MARVPESNRSALESLFEKTDGRQWRRYNGWLTDLPLGQWFGVEATDEGEVKDLFLAGNNLRGSIPDSLSSLTALQNLRLYNNQLSGSIPDSLSSLTALQNLHLYNNQLSGEVPSSLTRLLNLQELSLCGNKIDSLPPELEPLLRDRGKFWSEVNRRKRERRAMQERSWIRQGVNAFSKLWHVIIPVVDDITDYVLLWHTSDSDQRVLWWICLVALALADADRAYALLYLVVAMITVICTVLVVALGSVVECWTGLDFEDTFNGLTFMWKPAELLSGGQPHPQFVSGLLLDATIWTVLGPRSRYSHEDFGGEDPAAGAQRVGSDVKIIDIFLEWHPYTWCGHLLFRCPVVLRAPSNDRERSRRALVMLKAVGETVVVDILFLVLGVVSGGSLNDVVAILSSVFSILELVIELQHYVNEAEPYLVEDDAVSGGV